MARRDSDLSQDLNGPAWLTSAAFAAAATALFCYPAWPGYMSYDSLMAYREAIYGVQTVLWPPAHAYLFWLSRQASAGVWGLFAFQAFTLFFAAAVALHLLVAGRRLALALCVCFALAFAYMSPLMGTLFAHWRDVPTASFTLLGVAAWLLAARRRSIPWLLTGVVLIGCAVALRYNAVVLVAPSLALMIGSPFLSRRSSAVARGAAIAAIALVLGLAWASTHWRLPDLQAMPAPDNLAGTQEFDLIGVSACADRNYLPAAITSGEPITPYQIRKAYDPRHLQLSLLPRPDVPRLRETTGGGQVDKAWRRTVIGEWRCYLAHRALVFTEQMGMARNEVFYPNHKQIDANPFGVRLAHPAAAAWANAYVERTSRHLWRRPFLLYLLAVAMVGAAGLRRPGHALFLLSLLAGALAYPAMLFFVAPAADARYIFPSSVMSLFLAVAGFGILVGRIPRTARVGR